MPDRLDDFFVSEATESLEQLDRLLSVAGVPDPQQLLALAAAVRGSALRAGAVTVASVAERLEDAARSIVSNNVAWSEDFRTLSRQTAADLKLLLRALNRWGPLEERRVRDAILRWEELEGGPAGTPTDEPESITRSAGAHGEAGDRNREAPSIARAGIRSRGAHGEAGGVLPAAGAAARSAGSNAIPIGTPPSRGARALEAALALRPEIDRLAREVEPLPPLIEELFHLIQLGLTTDPAE